MIPRGSVSSLIDRFPEHERNVIVARRRNARFVRRQRTIAEAKALAFKAKFSRSGGIA